MGIVALQNEKGSYNNCRFLWQSAMIVALQNEKGVYGMVIATKNSLILIYG